MCFLILWHCNNWFYSLLPISPISSNFLGGNDHNSYFIIHFSSLIPIISTLWTNNYWTNHAHYARWSRMSWWKTTGGLTMHLSRWVWMTSGSTSFTFRTCSSAFTPSSTRLQSSMRCSKLAGFWKSWNFVDTSRSFLCWKKWKQHAIHIRMNISLSQRISGTETAKKLQK